MVLRAAAGLIMTQLYNFAAWAFYWVGHFVSRVLIHPANKHERMLGWTIRFSYPLYNTIMGWSCAIQDMGGDNRGPWQWVDDPSECINDA
jgi:hypothetical protein